MFLLIIIISRHMDTKRRAWVDKWKGRNLIKEIRNEEREAIQASRQLDPTYRKLIVKHETK